MAFEQCFDTESVKAAENGVANLVSIAGKFNTPATTRRSLVLVGRPHSRRVSIEQTNVISTKELYL